MARSRWKVPFIAPRFFRANFLKAPAFNTRLRSSLVGPYFVDKVLRIYNGNALKSVVVRPEMVGRRLGEFSVTKIMGRDIAISVHLKARARKKRKK